MKIFVAGASGAIGKPLIAELIRHGHRVTGMTQSEAGAARLAALGAAAVVANAFDAVAVEAALRRSGAEVVIDELTSLPKDPADMPAYQPNDAKLRWEGGGNLHRAAEACGGAAVYPAGKRIFLKPKDGLAEESDGLAVDASPGVTISAQMYAALEQRVLHSSVEGVALRYGFFYGPSTWYYPDGGAADQVRRQQVPVIGAGQGVWSFVHIEDAALATVAALTVEPGIYNVVDDDPSPVSMWLPKFAEYVGAPPPPHVTEQQALQAAGEDAVYYGTKLSGASNAKAGKVLSFRPRRLEWLRG